VARDPEPLLSLVRAIPRGRVTTYGDLAPGAPRFAGAVLSQCHDPGVPWHRVVRADGSLAKGERQRRLLEGEGVPFRGTRVDMRAAWVPALDPPRGDSPQ
jgi:methylated-DNA-protein-cysteine methyltransferase related protein